ncbi:glycosyltransferase [Zobellia roscoffensis]|uniref:glycosyltransferase n=1 Tax=Zobellia roscoffensis TaxID=2779508 RepID=UPI00188B6EEA|nr:glycosyltransferase [Zobellia roscoffensis]
MSKKKKLLLMMHLPPPVHGASVVGKQIQDSSLINIRFKTTYINMSASTNVADVGNVSFKKILFLIRNWWECVTTVISLRPALCYITPTSDGWGFYRDFLLVQTLKIFNVKIILHFHNKGSKDWNSKKVNRTLLKTFFKKVKIILLGKELYPEKAPFIEEKDVFYCPNGMPALSNKKGSRDKNEPIRFLYLSNMMETKGVFELLEACYILKEKGYQFICDYVGGYKDVTESTFKEKVKELNLTGHVTAHGPKYGDDKKEFFDQADVFVFPTFYHGECFPLVLIEAMDYSLPCITTDNGAIPSLVNDGETGFCIAQKSASALSQKMIWFIENPDERHTMGDMARKRFENYFTIQKFEQNMTSIFEECIKS